MKKTFMVLKTNSEEGKKLARDVVRAYEKVHGKGSCSVAVLPLDSDLCVLSEDWETASEDWEMKKAVGGCVATSTITSSAASPGVTPYPDSVELPLNFDDTI